ncbi:MAG: hypothetical protein CVU03_12455 [Bacteroidetes bacterium HGW-Bacteroidetes-2]|jgi:serine/threonine protein kinase|nr:MAG: hypothetical protein CVU03_12455 [Bacteroidetes bacterium HGW-Bacteroidetes-2]
MDILKNYHSLKPYKDTPEVKVFKAKENSSQNEVVLKLVKKDALITFSKYSSLLQHKNIVKCYKTIESVQFKNDKYHLSILEYLNGKSLEQFKFKDCQEMVECILQATKGVAYLHRNNIIHGDLKPGNIIVVKEQEKSTPKILDYSTFFTQGTKKAVTPEYLAPEYSNGFSKQTDIWALGCIIYQLFTGKLPFGSRNEGQDINTILKNSTLKPLAINFNKLPEPYRKIVIKALDKNPEKRYKNLDEVLKELNKKPGFLSKLITYFYYLRKSLKNELIVLK